MHIYEKCTMGCFSNGFFNAKYFYILLVGSGMLVLQINEVTKQLSGRELIVIPRKSLCKVLNVLNKSQVYVINFTFDFAFKNSIRKLHIGYFEFFITRFTQIISLNKNELSFLVNLFKFLGYKNKNSGHQFQKEIILFGFNLLLYQIAEIYFNNYKYTSRIRPSGKEKFVVRFFRLLEQHCYRERQVIFYADALSVTIGHLNRIVKLVTGKTVKQYIDQAIILEMKFLLQDNNLTISEIMDALHFNNLSFMGKFFKRHTGMSPTEYRLKLKL